MSNNVFQNIQLQRIADAMQGGGSSVTINMDVTGFGDMQGATSSAAGVHGLVPAPAAGDENKVLTGAGAWVNAGGVDYSLTEQNTGLKWIDGSYIYTATIPFTISSGGAYTRFDTNIVADNIIKYEGCGVHVEGTTKYMIQVAPYKNPPYFDFGIACLPNVDQDGHIWIDYRATTDVAGDTAHITLYYTKSA